jgi:hypothetical protein
MYGGDVADINTMTGTSKAPETATVDCVKGFRLHKKKVSKMDACLLNDKVVFPWLRIHHLHSL